MKIFSKASEYAIVAMMHVVARSPDENFSPGDVCADAGIPESFGRKALGELARARILKATRGPGGGYRLARDLREVSLLDIVLAVDVQQSVRTGESLGGVPVIDQRQNSTSLLLKDGEVVIMGACVGAKRRSR